jgi:hypothetical protein
MDSDNNISFTTLLVPSGLSILSRTRLCHAVELAQDFCAKLNGTLSGLSRLPARDERVRSRPQIHLLALAIGALDDGFDRRLYDSPGRQSHLQAVSD